VTVASYRDATVVAGRSYAYRVTAVSDAGNESGPGNEVMETAPGQ
jgi:fibronectin type 3 domain-containing protein